MIEFLQDCAKNKLLANANDVSEGGVAVSLFETAFKNGIGFDVGIKSNGIRIDFLLFGESQNVVIVGVEEKNVEKFKKLAEKLSLPVEFIGKTGGRKGVIKVDGKEAISGEIEELKEIWRFSIEKAISE